MENTNPGGCGTGGEEGSHARAPHLSSLLDQLWGGESMRQLPPYAVQEVSAVSDQETEGFPSQRKGPGHRDRDGRWRQGQECGLQRPLDHASPRDRERIDSPGTGAAGPADLS